MDLFLKKPNKKKTELLYKLLARKPKGRFYNVLFQFLNKEQQSNKLHREHTCYNQIIGGFSLSLFFF